MAQSPDEVDEIRSQIEETRAEMSDTIDAIQTRLSPTRVLTDAKESVTDATTAHVKQLADRANEAGERVFRYVQDNPVPSAFLATAGIGLLVRAVTSAKRRQRRPYRYRTGPVASSRRLLALASAGTACWLAWRAQQSSAGISPAPSEPHQQLR